MAQLNKNDREALTNSKPWTQTPEMQSPRMVEQTPEGRARYIRWATEAAKFHKGAKPVRFTGKHWKL